MSTDRCLSSRAALVAVTLAWTSGASAGQASARDDGLVPTPFGYAPRACGRIVADGEVVTDGALPGCASRTVMKPEDTLQPSSFVAWANVEAPQGMQSITATFTVPPAPETSGNQILYIFPSLTGVANPPILQPVLQWGVNGVGEGGAYWAVADWYLDSVSDYAVSKIVRVNAGDVLEGSVVGQGCDAGVCTSWTITTTDTTNPALTVALSVTTTSLAYLAAQGGVLEDYQVTSCDELPGGPLVFSSLALVDALGATLTPAWALHTNPLARPCGYGVTSPTPQEVDITFGSGVEDAGAEAATSEAGADAGGDAAPTDGAAPGSDASFDSASDAALDASAPVDAAPSADAPNVVDSTAPGDAASPADATAADARAPGTPSSGGNGGGCSCTAARARQPEPAPTPFALGAVVLLSMARRARRCRRRAMAPVP